MSLWIILVEDIALIGAVENNQNTNKWSEMFCLKGRKKKNLQ